MSARPGPRGGYCVRGIPTAISKPSDRGTMSGDVSPTKLTKHLRWLGDKMRQLRELTRVKMRIVVQKQKGESLAA
jgi:hypothetical protein